MCHEASGRDLTAAIGTGKGTVDLADWDKADAIWLMDDDAATNAPRMLTWLAEADRRGAELVHINPLIEAASRHTIAPHEFADIATFRSTKIGTRNVQVRIGGDMTLLRRVAKAVFDAAAADRAVSTGDSWRNKHVAWRSTARSARPRRGASLPACYGARHVTAREGVHVRGFPLKLTGIVLPGP